MQGIVENLPETRAPSLRERIVDSAKSFLMAKGINGLTMDGLAKDLGVSKKTLYVHFPGKDAIMGTIIDAMAARIQKRLEAVMEDPRLNSTQKLCRLIEVIGEGMSHIDPAVLRDLQLNAPASYAKIDAIRRRNVPRFFGRIIRDGMIEGAIRKEIDPAFATEFWLQAMRGMLDPETLERTQRTPHETLRQAVDLYFRGLMTPLGRDVYQDHCRDCKKHG